MKRSIVICAAIVGMLAAGQAFGITHYKDGITHNVSTLISDDVWVDSSAPGVQTTVNLLTGGSIGTISAPRQLVAYTDGKATVAGGYVNTLAGHNNSQLTVSSGSVFNVYANDSSKATISGGALSGNASASDNSQLTVIGGSMKNVLTDDTSKATMSGGSVAYNLTSIGASQITLSGGSIGGMIAPSAQSRIKIEGFNFAIDGIAVDLGGLYARDFVGGTGRLTGTLANGGTLDNQFLIGGDDASIILVPEPATMVLLGLGGMVLRARRRSR